MGARMNANASSSGTIAATKRQAQDRSGVTPETSIDERCMEPLRHDLAD